MPPKRKKRAPKTVDPDAEEKVRQLEELLATFRNHCDEYESYLNALCEESCEKITKAYNDKLRGIPEHIRKMTVAEIVELQAKENVPKSNTPKEERTFRSAHEKKKDETGKKRTLKREKKRSLSATASNRRPILNKARDPTATFSRISRTLSDSTLSTPASRMGMGRIPSMAVTPKFDPKHPISKLARKPRADEILMSMSGSPIQNLANEVSLSLGQGKVLTFKTKERTIDPEEVEKELIKQMDEPLKETLKNVKETLDKILTK